MTEDQFNQLINKIDEANSIARGTAVQMALLSDEMSQRLISLETRMAKLEEDVKGWMRPH